MRRVLTVAFAVCVACGGRAIDPHGTPPQVSTVDDPESSSDLEPGGDPQASESAPGAVDPEASESAPMPTPIRQDPADVPPEEEEPMGPEERSVQDVLDFYCGECHSAAPRWQGASRLGWPDPSEYALELESLIEQGWFVPLDSTASPSIRMMRDGSMPPPGRQPRPTEREIQRVANYVDNPDFWPDFVPPED